MVFAQTPSDVANYLTAAINLGALGILGWFLLRVNPQCARDREEAKLNELRLLVSVFMGKGESQEALASKLDVKIEQVDTAALAARGRPASLPRGK